MAESWFLDRPPDHFAPDGRPVWRVCPEALTHQVEPAYGGDWNAVQESMLADVDDAETISLLAPLKGSYRDPIVLDRDERSVANGMHRIVAAIISGAERIAVTDAFSGPDCYVEQLNVEFTVQGSSMPPNANLAEAAMSALRSFPIGDAWTETDLMYGNAGIVGGYWYWPAARQDELVEAMVARAAKRGMTLHIESIEVFEPDDDL